jgi:hypothetical protein
LHFSPLSKEPIQVGGTEKVIQVHLPAISNKWEFKGEERVSQSVMMLSGVTTEAGDGVKVLVDPHGQKQTQVTMDISNSLMFNAENYLKQFTITKEGVDQPRYDEFSSKRTAMEAAIAKQFKGRSVHDRVKAVHYQHTADVNVDMEGNAEEVGKAVSLKRLGEKKNPQNVCHMELTAGASAYFDPDGKESLVKTGKKVKSKKNK